MSNSTTTVEYLARGRVYVRRVGRDAVTELLAQSAAPWSERMRFTRWQGGLLATKRGKPGKLGRGDPLGVPFDDFVEQLK